MLIILKKSVWSVGGGLSRDSLDLDSYWLRTDLTRVHVQKVSEELVVSVSWRIIIIKPPSLTFWNKRSNKNITGQCWYVEKNDFFFPRLYVWWQSSHAVYTSGLCCRTYLNRNVLCRWTLLCNPHTVSAPVPSWGIKDPRMRCDCKTTTNSFTSEFGIICIYIFVDLSHAVFPMKLNLNQYLQIQAIERSLGIIHCSFLQSLPSLRVESVAGVLWLDSGNRLSLHVDWVGANPWRVHLSQVF